MHSSSVSPPMNRSSLATQQKPSVISSPSTCAIAWSSSTSELRSPWPRRVISLMPLKGVITPKNLHSLLCTMIWKYDELRSAQTRNLCLPKNLMMSL